jgi:hypothetical protein
MNYSYPGALALIRLHDQHMRSFLETWKKALLAGVILPETDDPSYKSMKTLLRHVFRSSRNYIGWICQKLELQDPPINKVAELAKIEQTADE